MSQTTVAKPVEVFYFGVTDTCNPEEVNRMEANSNWAMAAPIPALIRTMALAEFAISQAKRSLATLDSVFSCAKTALRAGAPGNNETERRAWIEEQFIEMNQADLSEQAKLEWDVAILEVDLAFIKRHLSLRMSLLQIEGSARIHGAG